MRVLERLADLGADVEAQVERNPPALGLDAALHGTEILAVDVLHDQEVLRVVTEADVEDLDDVAMLEEGEDLGLCDQELDEALVLREVGKDALDRNGLLEAAGGHGLAAEDFRHAADADTVEQLVTRHVEAFYHAAGHATGARSTVRRCTGSPRFSTTHWGRASAPRPLSPWEMQGARSRGSAGGSADGCLRREFASTSKPGLTLPR